MSYLELNGLCVNLSDAALVALAQDCVDLITILVSIIR